MKILIPPLVLLSSFLLVYQVMASHYPPSFVSGTAPNGIDWQASSAVNITGSTTWQGSAVSWTDTSIFQIGARTRGIERCDGVQFEQWDTGMLYRQPGSLKSAIGYGNHSLYQCGEVNCQHLQALGNHEYWEGYISDPLFQNFPVTADVSVQEGGHYC